MYSFILCSLKKVVLLMALPAVLFSCKKKNETEYPGPLSISNAASWIGPNWATLRGQVNGKGKMTVVTFQYDTTTTYANTVSPSPDTTSGSTLLTFSAPLNNLMPKTKYHFRIEAVNALGTSYGADVAFVTTDTNVINIDFNPGLAYDSIFDNEGNKYRTIQIGTQTWLAENLRSTKYNDGSDIPFINDPTVWGDLSTPGYTWFNNDSIGYGAIYNWYTISTGILCPAGWHVPTDDEWTVLTDYLGGMDIAGGKMKETGTSHWVTPNTEATNESGFTALPAGYRSLTGAFHSIGSYGFWWTSTEWSSSGAWYRDVYFGYGSVDRSNSSKKSGATVRCLKD